MWDSESIGGREFADMNSTDSHRHDVLKTDGFERRDHSWYVASDIPSDLLIKVKGSNFHLHKYPLLARCGRVNRIMYESGLETEPNVIELNDIPGGPESFELASKFCYGIAVDLTASNISGLRCAAEYLEMTEDLEEGNLIFKTEAFLSYVVLSSWRDSIVVLKTCEGLSPWSENLQIVRRCSESIAWKACASPKGVRWAYTGRPVKTSSPKFNGDHSKESSPGSNHSVPLDWWFEDVSILRIDHFVRVVTAIRVKGMRSDVIGAAIMYYATKWLPGLTKEGNGEPWGQGAGMNLIVTVTSTSKDDISSAQFRGQRTVIESLISIVPPQRDCLSCSFLLRLLRLANMLKVAPALVTELEKRVGMQLEQAMLSDLLIPSFDRGETVYDIDLVQRLVEHFLVQEQTEESSPGEEGYTEKLYGGFDTNARMRVARLLDSYLTEVSRDRNLSQTKFQVLAEALPESARSCDDGLYRAVDSYLKAHPTLTEMERKRLCRVMDCQKLSIDACMHAAQNERLPLRVIVQVLFSEQVKISNALANSSLKNATEMRYHQPAHRHLLEVTPQSFQEGWATAKKDIDTVKLELESMRAKYSELQNNMNNLQRQFDKLSLSRQSNSKQTTLSSSSGWGAWKKLSRLTRIGNEANDVDRRTEQAKKGPRRWRNSIS